MSNFNKCPICGHPFKSDECKHFYEEINKYKEQREQDKRLNRLIDNRLRKHGLIP